MTPTDEALYWLGNIAKTRIICNILRGLSGPLTIFDYGAGRGGEWDVILRRFPQITLICYEPDAASFTDLSRKLAGLSAQLLTGNALAAATVAADVIVSFSVLEHVYDRRAYLATAYKALKPGGRFYLNYDDGHFRKSLDLSDLTAWPPQLVEHTGNLLAPLWPRLGRVDLYQARVGRAEADAVCAAAGFTVLSARYENLAAFKRLFKTIPHDRQQAFCRFWLEAEDALNCDFAAPASPSRGDDANLWQEMLSRTLELTRSG